MFKVISLTAVLAAGTVLSASAAPVVFTSGSVVSVPTGQTLKAQASFEVVGTNLVVTLSNIGGQAVAPADLLTGVYFDLSGAPTLISRVSAVLGSGSSVVFGTSDPGGVVGGEFAFKEGLSGAPGSASYGISSSGLGLFGPGDVFPGTNLQGPADPDGPQYGMVSSTDDTAAGNSAVTGSNALIKNTVVFTLGIGTQSIGTISNVSFQYGTALSEPNITGSCTSNCGGGPGPGGDPVPTPATLALLGAGLMAVGFLRRRRLG